MRLMTLIRSWRNAVRLFWQHIWPCLHPQLLLALGVVVPLLAWDMVAWGQSPAADNASAIDSKGLPVATEKGFGIFQQTCLACHGRPEYKEAPSPATLRTYSPERIYNALTSGSMKTVGDSMSDTDRRLVAQAVAGRLLGTSPAGDAKLMPNQCRTNPPLKDVGAGFDWNGWGNGVRNHRFQNARAAGLSPEQVSRLKLKWAFGLPNSTSSYSQPTVVSGRIFVGSDTGYIYSLDAATGCVYWSYLAKAGVRNALTVVNIDRKPFVFFGDLKANGYALDARSGQLLWSVPLDDQFTTRVTATPAYYKGRLFFPISSWEEFSARSPDYSCCTAVGSIVAIDAATGKRLWKTYVIPERPKPVRQNIKGVQLYAPAGGAVWNTPAVDVRRNAIYLGTGDGTTFPAAKTSDAVMAMDMRSGRILWSYQVTPNDSFLVGCRGDGITDNCPQTEGPDWDIPVSPILTDNGRGLRLVVVGTKPGDVVALDPDQHGKLIWRMNVSGKLAGQMPAQDGSRPAGIMWGGAVYDGKIYYGLTNGSDVAAIDLSSGKLIWRRSLLPPNPKVSYGSPVTAIPGAVFVGGSDGNLFAVSTGDGSTLWRFDTDKSFDTVNKVPAHGGGFSSQGATVAGGMLFVGSGYSTVSSNPGNVILAFVPE
jgi:polyvinyl alcohol dehydrogenase (cytochrome)